MGHSYGKPEPTPSAFPPDTWHQSEDYLYGIDLYNFAYWWECHEVFEGLWHIVGRNNEQGNFFQALIHLAAANIKNFCGNHQAAENLIRRGLARLETAQKISMGIDVASLIRTLQQRCVQTQPQAPPIRLAMPTYKNEAGQASD
jgi:uncharacterized protein